MTLAVVVGAIIGVVTVALVMLGTTDRARRRIPERVLQLAPTVTPGLLGVVASGVVGRIVNDRSWLLFWVQLAATLLVIGVLAFPLRHRLRMTELPRG